MAVTAYASGDPAPITNPNVDPSVDLSAVSLPQTVQLYGDAQDSTDPLATFTWSWTILAKPAGSSATLSSSTAKNPTIDVDVWGNYLIALVATSSTTLVSEADPLEMPDSAFVVCRILSATQGIQKPAAGERNWHDDIYVWADRIEAFVAALPAHTLTQHSDIVDTTGQDVEALTSGGYATAPATTGAPSGPGGVLHKHVGTDIDPATTATNGVVRLSETPTTASAPTVLSSEHLTYTAQVTHSFQNGQMRPVIVEQLAIHGSNAPHAVWWLDGLGTDLELLRWSAVLQYGGDVTTDPADNYIFELFVGTQANVAAQTMTALGGAGATRITGAPATDGEPLALEWTGSETLDTTSTPYVAVVCTQDPEQATSGAKDPGAVATFTLLFKRSVA